ncbi:hypothetical protein E2C06_11385 [Dankookia rubra]|uniref:Uncharacterized protein n=1 Tax=Dankookia rubra TaxID=1442381 RepID=A0A4R5QH83_9PROT|nr:hypothetical protein [Dankookia rubra]TDH62466.1 hypothetical protein E2C06_11385 [Dankookia rubra]
MQANRRDARRNDRAGWWCGILVLGLALAAAAPALAQKDGLYDEGRVLEHMRNECRGTPDCMTVESRDRRVAVGQSAIVRAHCPSSHPHVVGWDTEQSEHLAVTALPPKPQAGAAPDPEDAGSLVASRVLVGATNNGDKVGRVTLFVGCSAGVPKVTATLRHRSGVPSHHTTFSGGPR